MPEICRLVSLLAASVCLLTATAAPILAVQTAPPKITLYQKPNFEGPTVQMVVPANDLSVLGFADLTASFVVNSGTWKLCNRINFGGRCITVGPGRYGPNFRNGFVRTVVSAEPVAPSAPT